VEVRVLSSPLSSAWQERSRTAPTPGAIGAVVVLGLLCTAAGFVVYAVLIYEAGASRATVITYVNPVVAVTLGVLLLGEQPGAGAVAGLLLILAGGWLSTDGRIPPGIAGLVPQRMYLYWWSPTRK
jgi:drug/metabolite transporter (DMT)-like permease